MNLELGTKEQKKLSELVLQPAVIIRVAGILFLILISALVFGIPIFLIIMGLWIALSRSMFYWKSTGDFLLRLLGALDETVEAIYTPWHWTLLIPLILRAIGGIYLIYLGLSLLISNGF